MTLFQKACIACRDRMTDIGLTKGKKADAEAIAFLDGYTQAASAAGVDGAGHARGMVAILICSRGYPEVVRVANGAPA